MTIENSCKVDSEPPPQRGSVADSYIITREKILASIKHYDYTSMLNPPNG